MFDSHSIIPDICSELPPDCVLTHGRSNHAAKLETLPTTDLNAFGGVLRDSHRLRVARAAKRFYGWHHSHREAVSPHCPVQSSNKHHIL